jgi:hypothetical protein
VSKSKAGVLWGKPVQRAPRKKADQKERPLQQGHCFPSTIPEMAKQRKTISTPELQNKTIYKAVYRLEATFKICLPGFWLRLALLFPDNQSFERN